MVIFFLIIPEKWGAHKSVLCLTHQMVIKALYLLNRNETGEHQIGKKYWDTHLKQDVNN